MAVVFSYHSVRIIFPLQEFKKLHYDLVFSPNLKNTTNPKCLFTLIVLRIFHVNVPAN